jgi:hypothetical protein
LLCYIINVILTITISVLTFKRNNIKQYIYDELITKMKDKYKIKPSILASLYLWTCFMSIIVYTYNIFSYFEKDYNVRAI